MGCPKLPNRSQLAVSAPKFTTACPQKRPPPKYKLNGVGKYLANIIAIFTTKFSTYLYVVCNYSWKCNVKIAFYYMFSITRQNTSFRDNTDSCTFTVISNEAV